MAHILTPKECYALMNELVHQATGQKSLTVIDTSSFVSAGETVLATGTENVINSLSLIIGRTMISHRPYNAKLKILNALNSGSYSNRIRKISYYSKDALETGAFNTDAKTNLANGYDNGTNGGNSTSSMWVQNSPVVLEMNFAGSDVWQDSLTTYEHQLKVAFTSENEFAQFIAGVYGEKANDLESQKEAFNRMALLNHMAADYDLTALGVGTKAINLTSAFNQKYSTNYTSEELRTTYLTEFLEFFTAQFKIYSDRMTNRSKKYHWSPSKTVGGVNYSLLRHTPKSEQRTILYSPLFTEAKAKVFPEIFHPDYLAEAYQHETVDFWQSDEDGKTAGIKITPAIPDTTGTDGKQKSGNAVNLDYVVGVLFDKDALMIDYQLEDVTSTPLEARKHYRTTWYTFSKNVVDDATMNSILFYMAD